MANAAHRVCPPGQRAVFALAISWLLMGAGGTVTLVTPLELFKAEVEQFASDVTIYEVEPNSIKVYGNVETRDAETLERHCAEIAALAAEFLENRSVEVFLRTDARTVHDCPPVEVGEEAPGSKEKVPPVLELPRPPYPLPSGLCTGDCMLSKERFRFQGYAEPVPEFYPFGRPWAPPSPRKPPRQGEFFGDWDPGDLQPSGPLPLVRIEPRYPPRALEREIEGWVLLEFSISPAGTVMSPFVVDSEPPRTFDRAALRAVVRWKYKPKVEDGVAVTRHGVQIVFTFELPDER